MSQSSCVPRYTIHWAPRIEPKVSKGDYVVATKYSDGDPGDQFCIGFYDSFYIHYGEKRHIVVDNKGKSFRHNGFRRVARVSSRRGIWMVENLSLIEQMKDRYSVWHWYRAPWKELHGITADLSVETA